MKNVLVLGIGNILLSDEGAGVRAVQHLAEQYRIPPQLTLIDGGTMGLEILPYLEGKTHLFLVDAVANGQGAGHVTKKLLTDPGVFFRNKISPHQLGISEVLGAATLTDCLPSTIILFGIEPKTLQAGLSFSPEVENGLPSLIRLLIEEIEATGIPLHPKAG
jgi:hydrogenase maturation protease